MALMMGIVVVLGELIGSDWADPDTETGSARRTSGSEAEGCWEIWAFSDRQGTNIIRVMQSESGNECCVVRDNLTVHLRVLLHPEKLMR